MQEMHVNAVRGTLQILAILVLPIFADSGQSATVESLIPFAMEDHQGDVFGNATWTDSRVVMFLASRAGTRFNRDHVWTKPLVEFIDNFGTEGETIVVSVADLRAVPRIARGLVRRMFAPAEDDPVGLTLLDWDGAFSEAYGLESAGYHLLVFDRKHRLRYKNVLLEFDPEQLRTIFTKLEEL